MPNDCSRRLLPSRVQILALDLGTATKNYAVYWGVGILILGLATTAKLARITLSDREERLHASGLMMFLGAAAALVLIVGKSMANCTRRPEDRASSPHTRNGSERRNHAINSRIHGTNSSLFVIGSKRMKALFSEARSATAQQLCNTIPCMTVPQRRNGAGFAVSF